MSNLASELSRTTGEKETKYFMGLFDWFEFEENFQALRNIYAILKFKILKFTQFTGKQTDNAALKISYIVPANC